MDHQNGPQRRSAEYSGKTAEEALENAARDLGIEADALDYQVVRDSTRSFLGLVRTGEVIVRVTWEPETERPPAATQEPVPATPEEGPEQKVATAEPEEPVVSRVDSKEEPEQLREDAVEQDDLDDEEPEREDIDLERNPPELESVTLDVLTTLLDKIGVMAAVEVVHKGGEYDQAAEEVSPLILNVVGDDLGILIGRRGETLRSLQFMTRLITSRRLGVWPNLVIDVEGYKERREEALRVLAQRVADQVRESGQPMDLEPMPAFERRIIHLSLRDDPDVYTESTGKEDRRKVQIIPK